MKIRKTIAMIMALSILGWAVLPVSVYAETEEKTYTVQRKDEGNGTDIDFTITIISETDEKPQTGYQAENPVTVDHIMYDILEDHAVIFGYEDELKGDLVIPIYSEYWPLC